MSRRHTSRAQDAFRWLLSGDDDEGRDTRSDQGRGSRASGGGRAGGRRHSGGGRAPYTPGFQLRASTAAAAAPSGHTDAGGTQGSDLETLQEAFAGVLPLDVIADVVAACGGDTAAATEALLAMAGAGEPASAGHDASPPPCDVQASTAAAAAPTPTGAVAPCYLQLVPAEIRQLIFDHLSLRDLARAARTCREFAAYVREQRRSLRTVVVPEGVSYTAVRGLVAAFGNAACVSLSRCAAQLRFEHEFEDMLHAVALGEADRPTGVPVSHISLARCGHTNDAVLSTLCDTFRHLRRLDLSRCAEVSDAGLVRLAAYTRDLAEGGDSADDITLDEEEVAAALGDIELAEGAGPPAADAAPAVAMESPDKAVRRLAEQRHAAMLEQAAATAKAQHRRPRALGLENINLSGCSITSRGVKTLQQVGSATAKSLQVLDVSRCPNLGGDALEVHPRAALEQLRVSGCNGVRQVVVQLPPEAPLRTLQLDNCRQLLEVVVVARNVETLSLSHCGQLRSVTLRCKRLRELQAVNCTNLNLAVSEVHCPKLQLVNLFGNRQLDAEGLEAIAPCLSKCARLDLTGCTSLSRVLLPEASALQTVSVSGCGLLRQVLLASPVLSEFRAAGCSRLMELRLGNASLRVLDLENCGHVREVQLAEGRGAPATHAGQAGQSAPGGKRSLVLRGCTSLPHEVKKRLRDAVLGG